MPTLDVYLTDRTYAKSPLLEPRKKLQSHQSSSWPRWGDHNRDSHDGQFNDPQKYTDTGSHGFAFVGYVMWLIGWCGLYFYRIAVHTSQTLDTPWHSK